MTNYYRQKQFIASVDKNDNILGQVEKWEAHKKSILHRGFTVILTYHNQYLFQHRKHPVFDGVFDFSFSSHQIYINNLLLSDIDAIYDALSREWNLRKKDLITTPKFLGKIYYKAKDPNSEFAEHEIDFIYIVETKILPTPNLDFAYGFLLLDKKSLQNSTKSIKIAPWVRKIIARKMV